jgi:hypothetical protein
MRLAMVAHPYRHFVSFHPAAAIVRIRRESVNMSVPVARYYDRYGFLGRDAPTSSSAAGGVGRFGARRGKVKYRARAADMIDYQAPVSSPSLFAITSVRKNPIIVIPVTKTRPIVNTL